MTFGKKIGGARGALIIGSLLMFVMGILCFTAHGIMPEALHLPYPNGEIKAGGVIGGICMLFVGISQMAAHHIAGGREYVSGWMYMPGFMSIFAGIAALVDPWVGTFTFEWVIAVFIAFIGIAVIFGNLFGSRVIGYKGWIIECVLALVMIACALGVVLNSAYAAQMAGISFIAYGLIIAVSVFYGDKLVLKA